MTNVNEFANTPEEFDAALKKAEPVELTVNLRRRNPAPLWQETFAASVGVSAGRRAALTAPSEARQTAHAANL